MWFKRTPFKDHTVVQIRDKLENRLVKFDKDTDPLVKDLFYFCLKMNPKERPTCDDILKH